MKMIQEYEARGLSHEFSKILVFESVVSPTDIYQGELGNCYFLSAVSAIAEYQERIKRLFLQRKRSPKGAYCVCLCIGGQFQEIYIDDVVLCKRARNPGENEQISLAFAQNNDGNQISTKIRLM